MERNTSPCVTSIGIAIFLIIAFGMLIALLLACVMWYIVDNKHNNNYKVVIECSVM